MPLESYTEIIVPLTRVPELSFVFQYFFCGIHQTFLKTDIRNFLIIVFFEQSSIGLM